MLCDQKKTYEELPFLLNSKHLNVLLAIILTALLHLISMLGTNTEGEKKSLSILSFMFPDIILLWSQ